MKRDMNVTLVFRATNVPEGVKAADIVGYIGHVIEDQVGTPGPEACAAMHGVTGKVLGHFVLPESLAGREPVASRLSVKGPSADMKAILGRYLEAGNLVGGGIVPVRPAMLKRTTLSVRLLLDLHAAGVSLYWLLSGEGEPLRDVSFVRVEGRLHEALRHQEALEGNLAEARRMARMTLDDLIRAKEGGSGSVELRKEMDSLRAQLRDMDAELAASRFSM